MTLGERLIISKSPLRIINKIPLISTHRKPPSFKEKRNSCTAKNYYSSSNLNLNLIFQSLRQTDIAACAFSAVIV